MFNKMFNMKIICYLKNSLYDNVHCNNLETFKSFMVSQNTYN